MTGRRHPKRCDAPGSTPPQSDSDSPPDQEPAGDSTAADAFPTPAWVPTDDVIGPAPERQVLVAGDTPTGLVLTGLLHAAGYDPVLANATATPTTSNVTLLSPAAVEVLAALDTQHLLDNGVAVETVGVRSARHDGRDGGTVGHRPDDTERAPPVVIPTADLSRALDGTLPAEATARNRTIGSVSVEDGGVAVAFDDGVQECFDLVVDAGVGRIQPVDWTDDHTARHDSLHQYEAIVDGRNDARIRDVWLPNGLFQRLPGLTDGATLLRITTDAAGPEGIERAVETVRTREELDTLPGPESFARERVRQRRVPSGSVPQEWWGRDRIACCGRAACPTAPASGVGTAIGLTDALGLVSVLTRSETTVPDVIDAYAASRARRFERMKRAVAASTPRVPSAKSTADPMRSLGVLRGMALEPFFGTEPAALGEATPG